MIRRLPSRLTLGAGVLLAAHVSIQLFHTYVAEVPWPLRDLFEVDEEHNLPTWYSAVLLLIAAALLAAIAARERSSARPAFHWTLLSFGFAALSLDEVAGVREALNLLLDELGWAPDWPFSVVEAAVVALAALVFLPFLLRLQPWVRRRFLLAGGVFLVGVLGIDVVAHAYLDAGPERSVEGIGYQLITALEEGLEMAGVILFVATLLAILRDGGPEARIEVVLTD